MNFRPHMWRSLARAEKLTGLKLIGRQRLEAAAMRHHLMLIHMARIELVKRLPQGDRILDLGGANCPLHKMGYPHRFKRIVMIDLPPDQRIEMYKEKVVDQASKHGEVIVQYSDMTSLPMFADRTIDLVWSGESIEHVPEAAGRRMCREAFRVLESGGVFCVDTPNRNLTEIHTRDVGGGYIHPEHCIEYRPEQLRQILEETGFRVKLALGVCEMASTVADNQFHYSDFLSGRRITENVRDSYIQYYECTKP